MQNISVYKSFRYSFIFFPVLAALLFTFIFVSCNDPESKDISNPAEVWVGTWSTAPQLTEPRNNPPEPGLSHNTLRQVARVSLGGDSLRVRFSNEFSTSPVTLNVVRIALSVGGSAIDTTTDQGLRFDGKPEVTIQPGTAITSDPFQFALVPRTNVAITIHFGETSPDVTGHPGSRTTSYLLSGNEVSSLDFPDAVRTDHWYIINSIDVVAPETAAAVVVLGNSITDGRGSGTNKQNRWPDELARRLQENPDTRQVAVLNQGIGGNSVLRGGLGPTALDRFDRDVLGQTKLRWLIILEGINDIGGSRDANTVAVELIAAYEQMIDKAHARGIKVYGGTILPFARSFYDAEYRQTARGTVNEWIRSSGRFDAVIDFDMAMLNPEDVLSLLPVADTGDHLHPNETGHRMMAEAVDLTLFK
jgi:lysophospholipase L1-like esterase